MMMRKTTDTALLYISMEELQPCREAILQLKETKWSMAHSKRQCTLLIRRRASRKGGQKAAEDLEAALAKVAPDLAKRLVWAWSSGGEERYFPTGEIMVLFDEGTSQAERKRTLRPIKGVKVHTSPDAEVKTPVKAAGRRPSKEYPVPGFSLAKAQEALAALRETQKEEAVRLSPKRPTKLCVPMARISVPDSRREEVFEIATQIAALPGVRAATPDIDVLGKNVRGEPQNWPIPPTSAASIHQRHLVHLAWALVDPSDLNAPPGQFLASSEKVAVLDYVFKYNPYINFALIGYDAADQDTDPLTPGLAGSPHGCWMCGIIGGIGDPTENQDLAGIAPGAIIVPVRPTWSTDEDFEEIDGEGFYRDYEEFVRNYSATWIAAIERLWTLSHSGLEVANMSIAESHPLWYDAGISPWMNWWVRTGNYGYGVFAAASAGNRPGGTTIAIPARVPGVFAVGFGDLSTGAILGNSGPGLEIVCNDGAWPVYVLNGILSESGRSGSSSVACAVVAGTVAIMKSLNPNLSADEVKTILRLTTRKAPGEGVTEDDRGYSIRLGWGFLNAYYAIDLARKYHYSAAELFRVKYRAGQPARAVIQIRHWPWSSYAGKRTGMFWALTSQGSHPEQRWVHDRNPDLRHIDQAYDVWGMPFGEFTLVGDFDGDGLDEIALQHDANEFWPSFENDPAHTFSVAKYDATGHYWQELGGRSPYTSGIASSPVVFPTGHPIRGLLAAELKGDGKQCIVAWQDNVINALYYDNTADKFFRLNPIDFAPEPLTAAIDLATGGGDVVHRRIVKAVRIGPVAGKDAVLCIGMFTKQRIFKVPFGNEIEFPVGFRHYLTTFVLSYDINASQWSTVPLSLDPNDTHLLLGETALPVIEEVLTGDFSSTSNPAQVQAVIHAANDRLYYLSLHRNNVGDGFSGYAIYPRNMTLAGRASRLRAGAFGISGPPTQLAWLSDTAHGNEVRFLLWNDVLREWRDSGIALSHGRKDNEAVDLAVAEGFSFLHRKKDFEAVDLRIPEGIGIPKLPRPLDVVALKMKEPDANTYKTYRWNSATHRFEPIGVL